MNYIVFTIDAVVDEARHFILLAYNLDWEF